MTDQDKPSIVNLDGTYKPPTVVEKKLARAGPAVFDPVNYTITFATVKDEGQIRREQTDKFNLVVERWKAETSHFSLTREQVSTQSFLRIVALGKEYLPLIFDEFRKNPAASWPLALEAITEENPALEATNYRDAVQLWLSWAIENKYLAK